MYLLRLILLSSEIKLGVDVQLHACRILNLNDNVIFLTSDQLLTGGSLISSAQNNGHRIVVIPDSVASKLHNLKDIEGNSIRNLEEYRQEYNDNFHFTFISAKKLTNQEQIIFSLTDDIFHLVNYDKSIVSEILISETMAINEHATETLGIWDPNKKRIVIKRSQLKNIDLYAGTLLHELAHAITGADDFSLQFEIGLTDLLGKVAQSSLHNRKSKSVLSKLFQRK